MFKSAKPASGSKVREYCLVVTGATIAIIAAINAVGGALVVLR